MVAPGSRSICLWWPATCLMDYARMACWFKCPNCGGDARDFRGIWRSTAATTTPDVLKPWKLADKKKAGPSLARL